MTNDYSYMQTKSKLSSTVENLVCCPICKAKLDLFSDYYECKNSECKTHFPIINKIPILINEATSVFAINDFVEERGTYFDLAEPSKIKRLLRRLIPDISKNIKAKENYEKFANLLLKQFPNPKVLVLGGSILGEGVETLLAHSNIELIESDISFGPRTTIICDAHSIPFEDNSFDGVIVQAVLEHVVDPWQCVAEIGRVLTENGLVYAETPFMQQVHAGCYDFTRFTYLGHRRLFRKFEEIDSGAVCGSGMALAWAYQYFLLSFTNSRFWQRLIVVFSKFTSFYLKYLDYLIINNPNTLDGASGFYFIGKKTTNYLLSDKELIKLYKGIYSNK